MIALDVVELFVQPDPRVGDLGQGEPDDEVPLVHLACDLCDLGQPGQGPDDVRDDVLARFQSEELGPQAVAS